MLLTRLGGCRSRTSSSRYRGIGIARTAYHHISTHNSFLVAMASAGKITKSLASMGGRQAAIKARSLVLGSRTEQY
jgi:hypothetical protein